MDWKLFWKVFRIGFGVIFVIAGLVMFVDSMFVGSADIAYCMFSVFTLILGLIMAIFGISALPMRNNNN